MCYIHTREGLVPDSRGTEIGAVSGVGNPQSTISKLFHYTLDCPGRSPASVTVNYSSVNLRNCAVPCNCQAEPNTL